MKLKQNLYNKGYEKIKGNYPVYGGGNVSYYLNKFNRENEIVIAKDGVSIDCVRYIRNKFFSKSSRMDIKSKR